VTELFDIGVNLTNRSLSRDLEGVLQRADDAGVHQMIVTGTTIEESRAAIELCARFPERLFSTCGVHPHHASEWEQQSAETMAQMARETCVRAIGETGLDFNRNYSSPGDQEVAFERQLRLAADLGMPLFCHQRDAHGRFVEILRQHRDRLGPVLVHCFTDSREALSDYLDLDCHIGITGWICDERRGVELQGLVSLIPADRLLIETDAPYLLPRDLKPAPASRVNEPAYLPHILRAVAFHRNQPAEELAVQTLANSREFFGLQDLPANN
jgi:TatD DNase family protein